MLNETYRGMLAHKSVIRETFMYGKQRAAQIGYENVFDYSLGNPSVPCPEQFTAAMQELLAQEDPVALHGYCPSQGDPEFRIEFPAETDPLKAHDVIDNIENDFIKRDGLQVTIHYDPIVTTDAAVGVLRTRLMEKARQLDPCLSIHDLRIVPGDTHTNVLFDLEFPAGYTGNKDEMLAAMCQFVHEQDPKYSCVVKVEQSYASAAHEK